MYYLCLHTRITFNIARDTIEIKENLYLIQNDLD